MAAFQVKVVNEKEVLAKLKEKGIAPRVVLEKAVEAAAVIIETEAKLRAPGPGIDHEIVERKATRVSANVGPVKEKWYYKFFETGRGPYQVRPVNKKALLIGGDTMRALADIPPMAARPFLRPAVDGKTDEARAAAGKVIKKVID